MQNSSCKGSVLFFKRSTFSRKCSMLACKRKNWAVNAKNELKTKMQYLQRLCLLLPTFYPVLQIILPVLQLIFFFYKWYRRSCPDSSFPCAPSPHPSTPSFFPTPGLFFSTNALLAPTKVDLSLLSCLFLTAFGPWFPGRYWIPCQRMSGKLSFSRVELSHVSRACRLLLAFLIDS
jgi:hypothetical protein